MNLIFQNEILNFLPLVGGNASALNSISNLNLKYLLWKNLNIKTLLVFFKARFFAFIGTERKYRHFEPKAKNLMRCISKDFSG